MEDEYDYVIIGTGLAETAISYILSRTKDVKILHLETNCSYGSDFSTYQYTQLLEHFDKLEKNYKTGNKPYNLDNSSGMNVDEIPQSENIIDSGQKSKDKSNCSPYYKIYTNEKMRSLFTNKNREFNIDLTPKLLLQDSEMKEFLLQHEIHEMVYFTSIKGSYLYTNKLHLIPTSEAQSLKSSVVSFSQKFKVINFFWNVRKYFDNKNIFMSPTMGEEFTRFGLNSDSIDFIGHAVALNLNDDYLDKHPKITYDNIVRYISSLVCYENTYSPYIYPIYGLSELCQAFSRKSALNGSTFMINAKIQYNYKDNTENRTLSHLIVTDPNGEKHMVKSKIFIADPKYFPEANIEKEIIRCIAILKKDSLESRNIIFLKKKMGRINDVFCVVLGNLENSCPEGYEIGIISTLKETNDPFKEIEPILEKLPYVEYFVEVRKVHSCSDLNGVVFTNSIDESPLLDNIYDDIKRILEKLGVEQEKK